MFDDDDDDGGGGGEGAPAWMATFADMATLLLTFFVLLLSFANMDIQDFKMALGSVKNALGVKSIQPGYFEGVTTNPLRFDEEGKDSQTEGSGIGEDEAIVKIKALIEKKELDDHMTVEIDDDNIAMTIYDQFKPGSANLEPKNFEELDLAAELCHDIGTAITVEGHTDDTPIGPPIMSNWTLSAMRAGAVARYLMVAGRVERERITVAGYADVRPELPNESDENRAKNRRIRVVLARRTKTTVYKTNPGLWRGD
ncbi:MAG: flagellar motor protein MotB [Deltaproteobacteria bacterium]